MPERMGRRPPLSTSAWQFYLLDDGLECGLHVMDQQRLPSQGDKDVIVKRRIGTPQPQVPFEPGAGRLMQRDETALAELGCAAISPSGAMSSYLRLMASETRNPVQASSAKNVL
jgi:hypothetical protein